MLPDPYETAQDYVPKPQSYRPKYETPIPEENQELKDAVKKCSNKGPAAFQHLEKESEEWVTSDIKRAKIEWKKALTQAEKNFPTSLAEALIEKRKRDHQAYEADKNKPGLIGGNNPAPPPPYAADYKEALKEARKDARALIKDGRETWESSRHGLAAFRTKQEAKKQGTFHNPHVYTIDSSIDCFANCIQKPRLYEHDFSNFMMQNANIEGAVACRCKYCGVELRKV
ncbi:hypothetical protein BJ508DRAFT_335713 [Ascobolus immersus RN42]|uniref:Uncharacterized protein n=1 Tax=Ascobolus immersus RN42 TaxID=1160509 RepID=A0A3N4HBE3_ASCIM|nr:hypothetical protein BJ508DRAFT_335713 [Ascobolus immersus RN42]